MKRIHPIVELPKHHQGAMRLLDRYAFKITDVEFAKHSNGFLCVTVNWTADDPMFKNGVKGCTEYSYSTVSMEISFPRAKYRWKVARTDMTRFFNSSVGLRIGIQRLLPHSDFESFGKIGYEPLFFQNLGWGVQVWFAPQNWQKHDTRKVIFSKRFGEA